MTTMLRCISRTGGASFIKHHGRSTVAATKPRSTFFPEAAVRSTSRRLMSTRSNDDAKAPTTLATIHLEDGSSFTGRSFGSNESVEGEVRFIYIFFFPNVQCERFGWDGGINKEDPNDIIF